MKYFRKTTAGSTVVYGRRTAEGFPGGKPLPGRRNIVLSSDRSYVLPGAETAHSAEEVLAAADAPENGGRKIFVIGGASVYAELLKYCGEAYVTEEEGTYGADRFLPDLRKDPDFYCAERSERHTDGKYAYRFCVYRRKILKPEA